jgi:hypothetical protein
VGGRAGIGLRAALASCVAPAEKITDYGQSDAGRPRLPGTLRPFALTWIVGALLFCAARLAHSASDTIDVSAIRAGMKGHGLTVFRGTTPERFEVEVIDVLHDFRPDQDLILVRTQHPVLEKAIVVGGMSGSPIWIEGKLAGAYAYGWLFGKEPVVGVTPIANMLAEIKRPVDPQIWKALRATPQIAATGRGSRLPRGPAAGASGAAQRARPRLRRLSGLPPYIGKEPSDALSPLRRHAQLHGYAATGHDGDTPYQAATPLMLAGVDERIAALLGTELKRFGLVALQTGSGGRAPKTGSTQQPARFRDGGAIGVELVRGDIDMTAIGTVTQVIGDRVIAFGHPMMNAGQPAFPTCTARVVHVLASDRRSFKIAEAETPLGTLIHDRQAAIVIDTAIEAQTVPVELRVEGVPLIQRNRWNVEVASHRMLTPLLTFASLANALSVTAAEETDVTFDARARVRVKGHGAIETRDAGYTSSGLGNPIALLQLRMFQVLEAAYGNPFEDALVESIEIDLNVRFERDVISIVDALVPSTEVDPGRDVNVYVTLQRFGQREEVRRIAVHVPASAAGQKIEIGFEPGNRVQLEHPDPENLTQLFDIARAGYPATSLVVSTKLPAQGLKLRGQVVRGLPASALDSLQLTGDSHRAVPFATQTRTEVPLGHVVDGSARVSLEVRTEPIR